MLVLPVHEFTRRIITLRVLYPAPARRGDAQGRVGQDGDRRQRDAMQVRQLQGAREIGAD